MATSRSSNAALRREVEKLRAELEAIEEPQVVRIRLAFDPEPLRANVRRRLESEPVELRLNGRSVDEAPPAVLVDDAPSAKVVEELSPIGDIPSERVAPAPAAAPPRRGDGSEWRSQRSRVGEAITRGVEDAVF